MSGRRKHSFIVDNIFLALTTCTHSWHGMQSSLYIVDKVGDIAPNSNIQIFKYIDFYFSNININFKYYF
jgi:hypothetical protein